MTNPIYLNVTERTKFKMTVCVCPKIEDLSDSFITIEPDIQRSSYTQISPKIQGDQTHYLKDRINETLAEWVLKIKPGSACSSICSPDIRELLATVPNYIIDRYMPAGFYRHGSRIFNAIKHNDQKKVIENRNQKENQRLHKIEEAKPYLREQWIIYSDMYNLASAIRCAIYAKYGIHNSVDFADIKQLEYAKRLCNWVELNTQLRKQIIKKQRLQDIKWIKKLWNDPTLAIT